MSTAVCESAAVEKIWLFLVGIVVFLSISFVSTPPRVSTPRLSGVTSSNKMSFTSPASTPAWIAAPAATASIGSTPLSGTFPNCVSMNFCTAGILVGPPIRIIFPMSAASSFASANACLTGFSHFLIKGITISSSFALFKV